MEICEISHHSKAYSTISVQIKALKGLKKTLTLMENDLILGRFNFELVNLWQMEIYGVK